MTDTPASSDRDAPEALSKTAFRDVLDNPEIVGVFDYWDAKRGDQVLPARRGIDPIDMPRGALGHLLIIKIEDDGRYRIRLAGTKMAEIFDRDITGHFIDDVLTDDDLKNARRSYDLVASRRQPWCSIMTYVTDSGREFQYQRLTLPLGENGAVTHLLTGLFLSQDHLLYESFAEISRRRGMTRGARREYVLA